MSALNQLAVILEGTADDPETIIEREGIELDTMEIEARLADEAGIDLCAECGLWCWKRELQWNERLYGYYCRRCREDMEKE